MAPFRKHKSTAILIDDHPVALKSACEIMKDDFDIVAALNDGDSALEAASIFNPDIVVIDIGIPGIDGFETARRVKSRWAKVKIIFLTVMEDVDYARAARDMGASYVVKRRMQSDLLTAVHDTMNGNLFFSPLLPSESHLHGMKA